MKIVYLSRSIIPSRTANSVHVMKMCQAFADNGHDVTLLAPWTKKLEEKNVENIFSYYGVKNNFKLKKVFSPNIKYLKKFIYSYRCFKIIKNINPDVVYGRDEMRAFSFALNDGYNAVFEKHSPLGENKVNDKLIEKMIFSKSSAKLVLISDALKQIFINKYDIKEENIFVAHDGSDIVPDSSIPKHISLDKNIQIGYIGSLFKGRGIDIIIELAQRIENATFHVIGGNEKDVNVWKNKVSLKNLIFHGFVEPKEAYKYRNMCEILLAPYQTANEGNRTSEYMSPIKLFEYMASKKTILTSDLPVIHEFLNNKNAVLIDPLDIDLWEEKLRFLIGDDEKRKLLSEQAYKDFISTYTWKSRAENILNYILH